MSINTSNTKQEISSRDRDALERIINVHISSLQDEFDNSRKFDYIDVLFFWKYIELAESRNLTILTDKSLEKLSNMMKTLRYSEQTSQYVH